MGAVEAVLMIAADQVSAHIVLWTSAISAAGAAVGALAGGLLAYLGVVRTQKGISARDREARESERAFEDERRRATFQRDTIIVLADRLTDMWAAGSDILTRKVSVLSAGGKFTQDAAGSLVDDLVAARVQIPRYIERLYDDDLRKKCWLAMAAIDAASQVQHPDQEASLRTNMGASMNETNQGLGVALRALH